MEIIDAKALLVGAKGKFLNNQEMLEALNIGIEALLKQMPKEIWASDGYVPGARSGYCGCGERLFSDEHIYCHKCGQKIKWE